MAESSLFERASNSPLMAFSPPMASAHSVQRLRIASGSYPSISVTPSTLGTMMQSQCSCDPADAVISLRQSNPQELSMKQQPNVSRPVPTFAYLTTFLWQLRAMFSRAERCT